MQLLRNEAPKFHTIEGIMGPNSLMVVCVDPLGMPFFTPPVLTNNQKVSGFRD